MAAARSGRASTSRSSRASSSRCSARTAPASRRCSRSCSACCRSRAGTGERARRGRPARRTRRSATCRSAAASTPSTRIRGVDIVRLGLDGARWGVPLPPSLSRASAERASGSSEVIELVGAAALRASGRSAALRRRAAAAADRPGAGPPAASCCCSTSRSTASTSPTRAASPRSSSGSAASQGVTVLLVAHDVNPILGYLDRVVYLAGGSAVEGTPREVITSETLTGLYGDADRGAARPPTGGSSSSASPRRPSSPRAPRMITELRSARRCRWNPSPTCDQLFAFHFMVQRARGRHDRRRDGRRRSAGSWCCAARPSPATRSSLIAFPGAAGGDAGRPAARARLLRRLRRRRAGARRASAATARAATAASRRRSAPCRRSRSASASSSSASTTACSTGLDALLFGTFLGITDRPGADAARRRRRRARGARARRRGRCSSPRSTATSPRAARRARPRALGSGFLLLLGLAVAATSQITGALLVFALLVTPAATAQLLTARPLARAWRSRSRSRSLVTWLGPRARLLLDLPGRLLRHLARVRPLRPVRRRARRRARAGGRAGLMLAHEFMRNAFLAGTFIALACGLVGYFVVLRTQVFAGDALSHVAFTGALAAAAVGVDVAARPLRRDDRRSRSGSAAARRARARRRRRRSAPSSPGSSASACSSSRSSSTRRERRQRHGGGPRAVRLDLRPQPPPTPGSPRRSPRSSPLWRCSAIARPLLFALARPEVARGARRAGAAARPRLPRAPRRSSPREATQAVGALLLLGLLAAPAGAARLLTDNPYRGLALVAGARGRLDLGRARAQLRRPTVPPSTAIVGVATAIYLAALCATTGRRYVPLFSST